jgi:hypothetical protein
MPLLSRSVNYWVVYGEEGNALIVVSLTEVPQPDLIEIVDTETSRNRVHEYCIGGGS